MHKSLSRVLFAIAFAAFAGVVWLTLERVELAPILASLSPRGLALNVLLATLFFLGYGCLLYAGFRVQYGVILRPWETLTVPLTMHLFTYLVPIKGGLLYQVFYMRHRYGLDISRGFSMGLTIFLISAGMAVLVGMGLNFHLDLGPGPLFWFLVALAAAFVVGAVLILAIRRPLQSRNPVLSWVYRFAFDVRTQLLAQAAHGNLLLQLVALSALQVVVQTVWFQQSARIMDLNSDFLTMLLVTLVLRIILLLRLVPGNLGFQELMIGLVFETAGLSLEEGLLVALLTRLVSLALTATIGLAALYSVLQSLGDLSMGSLVERLRR